MSSLRNRKGEGLKGNFGLNTIQNKLAHNVPIFFIHLGRGEYGGEGVLEERYEKRIDNSNFAFQGKGSMAPGLSHILDCFQDGVKVRTKVILD